MYITFAYMSLLTEFRLKDRSELKTFHASGVQEVKSSSRSTGDMRRASGSHFQKIGPPLKKHPGAMFDALLTAPEPFIYLSRSAQDRNGLWTVACALQSSVNDWTPTSFSSVLGTAETVVVVPVRWIVPVAIGAAQVVWIIVPRPAAQHPLL